MHLVCSVFVPLGVLVSWWSILFAAPAYAAPAGRAQFQVNAFTAGDQAYPAACVDAQGRATLAWESRGMDGAGNAVVTRRYDRDDAPLSGEVVVNSTRAGDQQAPAITCTAGGDYVVVWESRVQDGDDFGIAAQRFGADGGPRGGEMTVNAYTAGRQRAAATCSDAAGNFVVAWQSDAQDGDGDGVFAQRFGADGARRGDESRVNQTSEDSQARPALACTIAGDFVVAWQSRGQDGDGDGIFARRFTADGLPAGDEQRVNVETAGNQQFVALAALAGGGFIAAWESRDGQDGDGAGIFARRLAADGTPLGDELSVPSFTAFDQELPAVAALDGGFVVAWSSFHDGDEVGVFARRFDAAAAPTGAEFQVNTYTQGVQGALSAEPHPLAIAAGPAGDVLIAWHSTRLRGVSQDGDGFGVFARGGAAPGAECPGDCNADRTVSIDELIAGVNLALLDAAGAACAALDTNADGRVTVPELIAAVAAALNGCPGAETA